MKIKFCGAAREVTGSQHLLTINGKQILLDCGMFQGRRKESDAKNRDFLFDPKTIDAVILSHAHIDHSGNIPNLTQAGFKGPIYATHATRDLCSYMLMDSAFIQEREIEYLNKKSAQKRHKKPKTRPLEPLYTTEDAKMAMEQFVSMGYNKPFPVVDGVVCSLRDAGHILGSSLVTLIIDDQETKKQIILVFTGDLGRKNLPLLRDPDQIERADVLITESTYGNRFHKSILDVDDRLEEIINKTLGKGGKIIIPAFAVERTQEIVYHLNLLLRAKRIQEIPIFVDSPLAVNITDIFRSHPECLDKKTWDEFINNQKNPFGFGRLQYITDAEDSKALNGLHGPAIIIAAAGMCEHGRILHHLKNTVEDSRNAILIVGYMAEHTLGRKILERQTMIKIFGEPYRLRAQVYVLDAFSAHADRSDLLDYFSHIRGLKRIFLVHGEESQGLTLQKILEEEGYKEIIVPGRGEELEI